jgi:hypothetical protein
MHQRSCVAAFPSAPMNRVRTAETFPTGHVSDLSVEKCDLAIELLVERVVGCHCTCPTDLLELARWRQKRFDLIHRVIPLPREASDG